MKTLLLLLILATTANADCIKDYKSHLRRVETLQRIDNMDDSAKKVLGRIGKIVVVTVGGLATGVLLTATIPTGTFPVFYMLSPWFSYGYVLLTGMNNAPSEMQREMFFAKAFRKEIKQTNKIIRVLTSAKYNQRDKFIYRMDKDSSYLGLTSIINNANKNNIFCGEKLYNYKEIRDYVNNTMELN